MIDRTQPRSPLCPQVSTPPPPALTYGSLFSGYRGLDLAVEQLFGARCVWHSEIDPHASALLEARSPEAPNHGDITSIDWGSVEPVDILAGGFPCQDISSAGKQAGIKEGTRSGLWFRYADAIRVLRPRLVVVENVSALITGGGIGVVLGSLAQLGYDAWWGSLPASAVGACHRRTRVFILAVAADADHAAIDWQRPRSEPQQRGRVDPLTLLPSPRTSDTKGPGVHGDGGLDLRTAVGLLTTPRARDHKGVGYGDDLPGQIALLPTPTHSLGGPRGTPSYETARRRFEDEHRRCLDDAVALLPTPTSMDSAGSRGRRLDGTPYGPTSGTTLTDAVTSMDWGRYTAAIARWELVTRRPAPSPTDERGRLASPFVEWMMGCAAGWVTGLGFPRTAELRMLGNGVVTLQAGAGIGGLLATMRRHTSAVPA